MDDKKVILNKAEFDKMEADLKDFTSIIESKTVCKIAVPRLTWSNIHGGCNVNSYDVQYVIGYDENEAIKELSAEIEKLREDKKDLNEMLDSLENGVHQLQKRMSDWKNLPWYKRLFIKQV